MTEFDKGTGAPTGDHEESNRNKNSQSSSNGDENNNNNNAEKSESTKKTYSSSTNAPDEKNLFEDSSLGAGGQKTMNTENKDSGDEVVDNEEEKSNPYANRTFSGTEVDESLVERDAAGNIAVPVFRAADPTTYVPQPPTGDLAYCPPTPDAAMSRFGYNVVQVKKPVKYWTYYRKNPHFSWRHFGIHTFFLMGCAYLIGVIQTEMRQVEEQRNVGMELAGDSLGKQQISWNQRRGMSRDDVDAMAAKAQRDFMEGRDIMSHPNDNYNMVKIDRPKEYTYESVRRR
eukprot:PhM_4_TR3366/c0_g1_i1/m.10998